MKFYQSIYQKQYDKTSNIDFFNTPINRLSENNTNICEGILTEEECYNALKEMKNDKSPGSDGLTVEFYKTFWDDIKKTFIESINYSFIHGHLTDFQKQSIISLIPKPNKDTTILTNWRPISLLNVDYKIATKAIANRIKKTISSIIAPSQTGFIKGRYIGENVRLIFEIIEYLENKQIPGLLFFSDFEKAYDTLNHEFMFKCLQHFNFGDDLIRWVKLFYHDISSIIMNNGYMSESFKIKNGVRQGCPLSSSLFEICIEILSNYIEKDQNIRGIVVNNIEIKTVALCRRRNFFQQL